MVARSAFAQRDFSYWRLVGTAIGLALVFVLPPLAVVLGAVALGLGAPAAPSALLLATSLAAWALMTVSHMAHVAWYGTEALLAPTLPISVALYALMTIDSARRHWSGADARWRGRAMTQS